MKARERFAVSQTPRFTRRRRPPALFAAAAFATLLLGAPLDAENGSKNGSVPRSQTSAVLSGSSLYTVKPCRLLDTRTPSDAPALSAGSARAVLTTPCGVSPTATAVSLNVAVTQPTDGGHLTLYPTGSSLPLAATINYQAGQTRSNNAIVSLSGGSVTIYAGQGAG